MKNLEEYEDGNGFISMDAVFNDHSKYVFDCYKNNLPYLKLVDYIKTPNSLHYKYFELKNRNLTSEEIVEYKKLLNTSLTKSVYDKMKVLDKIFHHVNINDLELHFIDILKYYKFEIKEISK